MKGRVHKVDSLGAKLRPARVKLRENVSIAFLVLCTIVQTPTAASILLLAFPCGASICSSRKNIAGCGLARPPSSSEHNSVWYNQPQIYRRNVPAPYRPTAHHRVLCFRPRTPGQRAHLCRCCRVPATKRCRQRAVSDRPNAAIPRRTNRFWTHDQTVRVPVHFATG